VVLSTDEVVRFLEAVPSLKTRTALTTAYAAGLRASETVGLEVGDIDSERGVILVHHGKDGKDRTVMLLAQLLQILRVYWRLAKPQGWLFPGHDADRSIDVQVLYSDCRLARAAAGIDKRVTALLPEKNTHQGRPAAICRARQVPLPTSSAGAAATTAPTTATALVQDLLVVRLGGCA
jgi:integrase